MSSDWNVNVKSSLPQFFIDIVSFNMLQEVQDDSILKM